MEYVDGEPLLAIRRAQRNCDVRARLRLFLEICEAVQFAHRRLVVHRDIKPSNVLVDARTARSSCSISASPRCSIPRLSDDTQTRMHAFTPAYAAPEQVRGELVTTAADIYALGVLLYELLSGERPYRLDETATPVEWARLIDGPLCSAPSVAARDARSGPGARACRRCRRALLHGDLDLIVLTALRREPERRYASVEALAADVQNYLNDRPITARARQRALRHRQVHRAPSRRHRGRDRRDAGAVRRARRGAPAGASRARAGATRAHARPRSRNSRRSAPKPCGNSSSRCSSRPSPMRTRASR